MYEEIPAVTMCSSQVSKEKLELFTIGEGGSDYGDNVMVTHQESMSIVYLSCTTHYGLPNTSIHFTILDAFHYCYNLPCLYQSTKGSEQHMQKQSSKI